MVPTALRNVPGVVEFTVFPRLPCVYFLTDSELRIVYVGQTTDLPLRISNHRRDKRFARVFYLPLERGELTLIERAFIVALLPVLNSSVRFTRLSVDAAIDALERVIERGARKED
jgi:hypothetical protein